MKKLSLLYIFLSLPLLSITQPYNNEWINFSNGQVQSNQQYFRISIWKEGIYRITYSDMQAAGIDTANWFQPSKFQLYHNGTEQSIEVIDKGQQGVFRNGDYIEFYGKPTDGELDTRLYDTSASQPNPYYSLFNDTAAYFLTYNPLVVSPKRIIIENDTTFSGYTPQSFYVWEETKQYTDEYNVGWRDAVGVADNSYTAGEGFMLNHNACNKDVPFQTTFQVSQLYGTDADVEVVLAGGNTEDHNVKIYVNGIAYISDLFLKYAMRKFNFSAAGISNGNLTIRIEPQSDSATYKNYIHVAYVKIRYKRNFDFTGMQLPMAINNSGASGKVLTVLNNISVANPLLYIISGDTLKRVVLVKNGNSFKGLVPVNNSEKKCWLADSLQTFAVSGNMLIHPVGNNGYFSNFNFLANNKEYLIITHKMFWNAASAYAAYRDSTNHPSLMADIDELYDQFAWGIPKHPIAIRNFCDFLLDNQNPKPKFLFLIGKSVISLSSRSGSNYALNTVPTYGEPPADQMFTSKLNTSQFKPEIATGRLSAQTESDIYNYLNKIRQYEAAQRQFPAAWMKRILHFGGGNNAEEQIDLAQKLSKYKSIIEDTLFGGHVETFLKNSSDPIQINQTQYLQSLIDDGCSMMTFYGHAAGSAFDVSTDAPENYTNVGKYPIILAQSCLVGDIHSPIKLLNERFVLAPQKAAIAFMAVPDKAYADELDVYSTEFHKQAFALNYNTTLGETMKQTVDSVISANAGEKSVCMNYTLHGDPAILLNVYPKRELSISDQDVYFTPPIITTQTEKFEVNVVVTNLAKTNHQPFQLKLTRTFPDGKSFDTLLVVESTHFKDTFSIKLPVDFQNGAGLNGFQVVIDEDNVIDEYENTVNNHAGAPLIINSTDINPVYPQLFAIVPTNNISLKATTANLFAPPRSYRFEVDTNDHFNSLMHAGVTPNASGIVSHPIPFTLDSDVVYYWRVANDSISSADTSISNRYQWKTSSFVYIPGVSGWSQAHFHQFRNDSYTNLIYADNFSQPFSFVSDSNSVRALNFYTPILGNADPGLYLNNALVEGGGCGAAGNAFALIVLDSLDNSYAWNTQNEFLGQINTWDPLSGIATCRPRYEKYFLFPYNNPSYVNSLVNALTDSIPCGDYIVLWSGRTGIHGDFDYSSVQTNLFNTLAGMGASNVNQLQDADIFLCFMRKCYPAETIFYIGDSINKNLEINTLIGGRWNTGIMTSSLVGPALQWNSLHWGFHSTETGPTQDLISLSVYGVNSAGNEIKLLDSISPTQFDVDTLNTVIDASTYPYLKLKAFKQDLGSAPTPPQMDKWQVYYQPVPEGALNTKYYNLDSGIVQEGQDVHFTIAFENISTIGMDTLLVNYFIYDKNNVRHIIGSNRMHRQLPAGDTIMTSITFNSRGYAGNNTLWVEVNPNNDQPEQYHYNNITSIPFYVKTDNTNPLLDVTFDGVHILNGDIVSAKPGILIQLRDENKFIALNDTSNYRIRLQHPDGSIRYLNFELAPGVSTNNALLKWAPAVLPKNSFKIEYFPIFATDGEYQLIISATDESGNLSGDNDYRIKFEIINRSTITNVINYPNPFSTATKFVFVLTGSEIPPDFNIQIMTVTGKIVRTITRGELGTIHIGRNVTDYAWDGRDEYGDRLANGVYLYRVVTRINGENIEQRETTADQYFTKGWGKMYLMR